MSLKQNDIFLEEVQTKRQEWLDRFGQTNKDVHIDSFGEYIIDVVDIEPHEPGGIYEKKIYIPKDLSLNIFDYDSTQ